MASNAGHRQSIDAVEESDVPYPLPETGFLRLYQIVGRSSRNGQPAIPAIIPVSRSTWWAGVKSGRYPKPVRTLGPNITVWRVEDIRALIGAPSQEVAGQRSDLKKDNES